MRGIGSVGTAKLLYTSKDESGDDGGIGSVGTANNGSVGTAKPLPVISPQVSSWVTLFLW